MRAPSGIGFAGGREASLVRQTIFCGRLWDVRLSASATLEIPLRDYTIKSNGVRPYDFKAPNKLPYIVLFTIRYIL